MLSARVVLPETAARAEEMMEALAALARRMDARPEPMRVRIVAPKGTVLDMDRAGRLIVRVPGCRARPLDLRRRWIADHPVPLPVSRCTLVFHPVDANRFRVRRSRLPGFVSMFRSPL